MKRLNDRQFWESAKMNNTTYLHYYNRLLELSTSMFEWKNLPDTVDPRFLELTLFSKGFALFFKDEDMGEDGTYLGLTCTIGGRLDVYNIPIDRRAYASNGYNKDFTNENSVLVFNNYIHTSSMLDVEMYARRLYDLDRSIDVNAKAQKTPIAIVCDENQRLTLLNLYKQYDGNEPFIFGNKGIDVNAIKSIQTGAPYVADKLYQLKTEIWNEALTYLGISNTNTVKKERMITDEVLRNQGGTVASRYSRLQSRREACEKINKMYGLNIEVNYREDYQELVDKTTQEMIGEEDTETVEGGDDNE